MSVYVWEEEYSKEIQAMLEDVGFQKWSDVPDWAIALAESLIRSGWKKK